jgi:hypothetical protein
METKSLKFTRKPRFNIPGIELMPISEPDIKKEEDRLNAFYFNFIDEINKEGGYVALHIGKDEKTVTHHDLACSAELLDKIHGVQDL